MKSIRLLIYLAITLIAMGCMQTSQEDYAEQIIGYWGCESGDCPDEEISFTVKDGIPSYNSWLHERPSASNGSWSLMGDQLKIECCAGLVYEYEIVELSDTNLVLRDAITLGEAHFTRLNTE